MFIKKLKLLLQIAFGLFFIQFGLNWSKDDLFNESNVEKLLKSGIKTNAYIMGDFKKRIYLTPKMGNVHYYLGNVEFAGIQEVHDVPVGV